VKKSLDFICKFEQNPIAEKVHKVEKVDKDRSAFFRSIWINPIF
jgi:hypothetical protein